jgi:hypothetical protein
MRKMCGAGVLILLNFFVSCFNETPLHHLIHETDVVKVYIYSGNRIAVKYITNDIEKIKEWDSYIANDTAKMDDCSFEGRLVFQVYEDSTVMNFSLKKPCQVVSYNLNGIQYSQSLTSKGIGYLNSLLEIK